jgi:putative transposase
VEGFYHVWFSTKERKPSLEGDIGESVKRLLTQIARRAELDLVEVETNVDHAHLLIRLEGDQILSKAMHQLKGASSRYIFLTYPDLRLDLGTNSFWQKSYGWRKVEPGELYAVRTFIRTQQQRPHRHE